MLKNYFKVAIRNIFHRKLYSFINIFGLTLGVSVFILIFLYVRSELSYDKFIPDSSRIFRIIAERKSEKGNMLYWSVTPNPLAPALMREFPEVEVAARYREHSDLQIKMKNDIITEKKVAFVDENFFKIFPFDFIYGNSSESFKEPYTIILTEETAKKYFGDENPVGKVLNLTEPWFDEYLFHNMDFKVIGVIKLPDNFHLKFNLLGSLKTIEEKDNYTWSGAAFNTYVKMKTGTEPMSFKEKVKALVLRNSENSEYYRTMNYNLQPLQDIHLGQNIDYDSAQTGDMKDIVILFSLSVLILIIACINYINLSTARSSIRSKEIGLRKVIGASRGRIISQFLAESVIIGVITYIFTILIIQIVMPYFNDLAGKKMSVFGAGSSFLLLVEIFGITIFTGVLSGIYPALVLSSFQPAKVIKNSFSKSTSKGRFRKVLILFQFAMTIFMLICFIVMVSQRSFIKNKDLGFDKENVLYLEPGFFINDPKAFAFKNELLRNSNILAVTVSEGNPAGGWMQAGVQPEGFNTNEKVKCTFYRGDNDFVKAFDMKIKSGRDFSKDISTDLYSSCLINEEAAKQFGWNDPIGKTLNGGGMKLTTIGIVRDFHITTLHKKIEPVVICLDSMRWSCCISVRVSKGDPGNILTYIKDKWSIFYPEKPFDYKFLDEELDSRYKKEEKMSEIFGITSILSIIIACIGLLGLISYSIEQRRKEISIRKILGSPILGIMNLLLNEFAKLILFSNIIAIPLAYYFISGWLQDFAYRISITAWMLLSSPLFTFIIAILIVGFQVIKAAISNPIESLRYE